MSDQYCGEIRLFAGNYQPEDWIFCDGRTLQISQYDMLFAIIGTTYGGDGKSTFKVPDLRGRAIIGQGQGTGLSPRTLGQTPGTETVTLVQAEMAAHTHVPACLETDGTSSSPANNVWATGQLVTNNMKLYGTPSTTTVSMSAAAISSEGGNQPHNNMQPFLALNYIMATTGIFPQQG